MSPNARNIQLANFISLLMAGSLMIVMLFRIIKGGYEIWFYTPLVLELFFYLFLILLFKIFNNSIGRILLCWAPPLFLIINFKILILHVNAPETSHYVGFRIFQMAFGCFPFLVFNLSERLKILIAISVPLVAIVFYDKFLDLIGIGYYQLGLTDTSYLYNNLRTVISLFIIGGSFIFLKKIIEKQEVENKKLIEELAEKNKLIQINAEAELSQLNSQLLTNFDELMKSEFVLKNAQRIAKVGSWEYDVSSQSLICSEELLNILELDMAIDGKNSDLLNALEEDVCKTIKNHIKRALVNNEETDVVINTHTHSGTQKWLRLVGYQLSDKGETKINGIIHDITVFKQSEEKLALSERKLKRTYERISFHINNTPLAVIERDKDFKIIYWNKRAEELFGWQSQEVIGLRPQDFLVHNDDKTCAVTIMNEAMQERRDSISMELRTVAKDGQKLNCLWYYSFLRNEEGELETILSFASDITEQRKSNYFLKERVKELGTLYNVSQLLTASGNSMHDVFTSIPSILPAGWQYPDITAAQLQVFDSIYQTDNFKETEFEQSVYIEISGKSIGLLQIVYLKKMPEEYEGPFFKEERDLLVAIAGMLQVYIEKKLEEQELLKSRANLSATINNTEILIWSVDQNFRLITFNEPFKKFATEVLEVTIPKVNLEEGLPESIRDKWHERYRSVLAGKVMTIEEKTKDFDLRYSLSPIIEKDKIIGVSIFGDNITEQNKKNYELAEANRKITEFKMMALRSVMNPHFIFNVLSSIQYFITRNDELNAINYLTSFSKLMRAVLTRSVDDNVSLKDELELLSDYVHLEKLRFEEKFDFNLKYDESLDIEFIRLPSLLIQPYVENAILHGLYNKEGKGSLCINVSSTGDFLVFEIEDDGVGRLAASEIREKTPRKRKSMGTQLTEERLAMLNGNFVPPVVYTDLYSRSGPSGTRVTIQIKINQN